VNLSIKIREIPTKIRNIDNACLDVKIRFIRVVPITIYYLMVNGRFMTINKLK
jgi:hypothetical protein